MGKEYKFTPKEWVLVRACGDTWTLSIFSHYNAEGNPICINTARWHETIPYEGNEHLLNTTDNYVEPYEPKDGDFVYLRTEGNTQYITIHHYTDNEGRVYNHAEINPDVKCINLIPVNDSFLIWRNDCMEYRPATEEEKRLLLSKLAETGKKWNPEKKCIEDVWTPEDGDFLIADFGGHKWITVFKCYDGKNIRDHCSYSYSNHTVFTFSSWMDSTKFTSPLRLANDEEIELMLSKLHEAGKDWDAEKKEIVEYRWKPKHGENYWFVNTAGEPKIIDNLGIENRDVNRIKLGNCFRTKEEAQAMADKFKKLLKGEQ